MLEKLSQGRDEVTVVNIAQIHYLPESSTELGVATRVVPRLSKVLRYVRKRWTENIEQSLYPFWRKSKELTVEGDTLLWGICVTVPSKLRDRVLEELHRGHPGVERMKALMARSHVWWPGLDRVGDSSQGLSLLPSSQRQSFKDVMKSLYCPNQFLASIFYRAEGCYPSCSPAEQGLALCMKGVAREH